MYRLICTHTLNCDGSIQSIDYKLFRAIFWLNDEFIMQTISVSIIKGNVVRCEKIYTTFIALLQVRPSRFVGPTEAFPRVTYCFYFKFKRFHLIIYLQFHIVINTHCGHIFLAFFSSF